MPFQYPIAQIAQICQARTEGKHRPDDICFYILTDSRSFFIPGSTLFFALKGIRHDGHHYIPELIPKGVTCFIVDHIPPSVASSPNVTFLVVPDTLMALQRLAAYHRKQFNIPVAGITGSNGKTIVKEWLSQLLTPEYKLVRSPLSFNSQVGVPLSVMLMDDSHQLALFEAGISHPGEMQNLTDIISPTIGILTGIGTAHDENFPDKNVKTLEKLKLFSGCNHLVCHADDPNIFPLVRAFAKDHNVNLFTIGYKGDPDLLLAGSVAEGNNTLVTATWNHISFRAELPFTDQASVQNSILCLGTMLLMGYIPEEAALRLRTLEPIAMRMEQIEGIQNCILINDSYNNDLIALRMALDHLKHINARPRKCIILSDIYQSGLDPAELQHRVATLINDFQPHRFIGIGNIMSGLKSMISSNAWYYDDTEQFLRYHPFSSFRDEVILLKGARSFRFERIRDALQWKSHGTILEINLAALIHNLNFFRSMLNKQTRIMAMVKASSYGGGSFEIASTLQYHQVDYLAVAYADEGVELRKAGITLPIMVMNPEERAFDLMIEHSLEPEIYSFNLLQSFTEALHKRAPSSRAPYPIHIETDTGMNRLGFSPEEIDTLMPILLENPTIIVKSVFSHLATAEDTLNTSFARLQIHTFEKVRKAFLDGLPGKPLFHILNSAGIINFPEAQFDMVRPGIGLYGIASDPRIQKELLHIGRLSSTISQIRSVPPGGSVGYNRAFTATSQTLIAIIAIGYADGFNRKLGNGNGSVLIRGHRVPVVGEVCMDMIMADVSGVPGVAEGDEVIIFDEHFPVSQMASMLGTIPYEVLTSVSSRVKRIYLSE